MSERQKSLALRTEPNLYLYDGQRTKPNPNSNVKKKGNVTSDQRQAGMQADKGSLGVFSQYSTVAWLNESHA